MKPKDKRFKARLPRKTYPMHNIQTCLANCEAWKRRAEAWARKIVVQGHL